MQEKRKKPRFSMILRIKLIKNRKNPALGCTEAWSGGPMQRALDFGKITYKKVKKLRFLYIRTRNLPACEGWKSKFRYEKHGFTYKKDPRGTPKNPKNQEKNYSFSVKTGSQKNPKKHPKKPTFIRKLAVIGKKRQKSTKKDPKKTPKCTAF